MNFKRDLLLTCLFAAGTAIAGGPSDVLFNFNGVVGVQPFRSQGGTPVLNTVAGVPPGGAPWGMTKFEATIKTNGDVKARGRGVVLWGTDNIGTRAGPRQVVVSLFCRGPIPAGGASGPVLQNAFTSAPVDLNPDGDFEVRGTLTDATGATPPLDCGNNGDNRPVLLVRAVTPANPNTGTPAIPGAWFGAGIIAPGQF
jgi:hypothetical protein